MAHLEFVEMQNNNAHITTVYKMVFFCCKIITV